MKRVLISDVDNTLFDWVKLWSASFSAMLDQIVNISGVDREVLKSEIKTVHQRHGTSEYAFLISEIPSLGLKSFDEAEQRFAPAIAAYRDARRAHLELYDGVET